MAMEIQELIEEIKRHMHVSVSEGLSLQGIDYKVNYGVSIPELKSIAEKYKDNHALALALFQEDIRECKILASMIDDPAKVTGEQIDEWAQSFSNVEIVEQVCSNLFWKSDYILSRSIEWCLSCDELMQRAGLIVAARTAKNLDIKDTVFEPYLEIIENLDDTQIALNKSTIAFALRQIGQRNDAFSEKVIALAQKFAESENEHRAWIGSQLLFDLEVDSD
jgi:3-methyladenine DNA glycosylase AlkD